MDRQTAILIIGAGAAGCTLGYLLQKAGADVLLLELQDLQTREKLCGGILESRARAAFSSVFGMSVDEAGLSPLWMEQMKVQYDGHVFYKSLFRPASAGGSMCSSQPEKREPDSSRGWGERFRSTFRSSSKALAKKVLFHALGYDPKQSLSFQVLPRRRLDNYIRNRCLEAGGRILDRCGVLGVEPEQRRVQCMDHRTKERFYISYQTLVGADGASSTVRRLLTGRSQRTVLALEAAVPLTDVVNTRMTGALVKGIAGYCWYIPRGNDVTAGCVFHGLDPRNAGRICRENLTAFCADNGIALEKARVKGALIPTGDDVLLQPGDHTYLIGDAAGLIDAFSEGGIHYALLSAQALAAKLTGGTSYALGMKPHLDFIQKNSKKPNGNSTWPTVP